MPKPKLRSVDATTVPKELTKAERESKALELAESVGELEKMRTKHADLKAGMRGQEKELREKVVDLALEVETGQTQIAAQHDAFEEPEDAGS